MEKVIGGKYAGSKVKCNAKYKYMYIVDNENSVKLTPDNVKDYTLKPDASKNGDLVYVVVWKDGAKSLVRFCSAYSDYFVSGCEVGALPEQEARSVQRSNSLKFYIVFCIFVIPIVAILLYSAFSPKPTTSNSAQSTADKQAERQLQDNTNAFIIQNYGPAEKIAGVNVYTNYKNPDDGNFLYVDLIADLSATTSRSDLLEFCDRLAEFASNQSYYIGEMAITWIPTQPLGEKKSPVCKYKSQDHTLVLVEKTGLL